MIHRYNSPLEINLIMENNLMNRPLKSNVLAATAPYGAVPGMGRSFYVAGTLRF
jgi:hypothetical protein